MGFFKKTVLLSNQSNYDNGMAILTIEKNNSGVFGSVKVFDIPQSNKLMLGISVDGREVIKQNVVFANGNIYNFKLNNDFNINGKIGCVLVDVSSDNVKALVWGTNGNQAQYKQDIIHIFEQDVIKIATIVKPEIVQSEGKSEKIEKLETEEEENNAEPNNATEFDADLFESDDEEIEEIIDREMGGEFFELIHGQIDELFKRFPIDEDLGKIIPNSKWIKVDYENNGKEYVFGLIFYNARVKYICYGVPSRADVLPPEELDRYSQWLPVGQDNTQGYWLMYQDADTGESIVIDDVKLS